MMRILGVIPARYGSGRMPGKPLMEILGKPMIWHVYQRAASSECLDDILIATDDERIFDKCQEYGMKAVMTSASHDTPTSRLYEVSTRVDADLYLMIMGDEPLVDERCFPLIIPGDTAVRGRYVAALTNVMSSPTEVIDPSNQKVVTNRQREAIFISRSPIPFPKGTLDFEYEKVTGVQIFSGSALKFYHETARSAVERAEENDLMRFIENGIRVRMIRSPYKTVSVDTPKDLLEVRRRLEEEMADGKI